MDIERKLKALDRIYAVYDEFVRSLDTVCKPQCHQCCTTHVTVTTLEAYKICNSLPPGEREKLFRRVREASGLKRFRPAVTTNAIAELCAVDEDLPAENEEPAGNTCPLLAAGLCSIYALRPFHCRCFISRTPCEEKGYADVDDAVLAVNTAFLQAVEHVDADGCSGNLLDVLEVLANEDKREACANGILDCSANGLVANRPMKVLMLPPEHREKIEPILKKLSQIRV
jgi:hypothetical protein